MDDTVTVNFSLDRNIYNQYKSIVVNHGENVKSNLVKYMQTVIQYRLNKFRRERDKALEAILEGYVTAEDVLMVMEEEIYRGKVPKLEDIL